MNVSKRNILPGLAIAAAALAISGPASAQCCMHTGTHSVKVPGVKIGAPAVTMTTPSVTVTAPTTIIGGGNVVVGGTATASVFATAGTTAQSTTIIGGGFYDAPVSAPVGIVDQLAVDGAEVCTPDRNTVVERIAPVQAVCLDDKGKPHPASRWSTDTEIDPSFSGEVYRCLAGAKLHTTVGQMDENGNPVFDGGHTIVCNKKEALVHENGALVCRSQLAQRECNERSLLRRNGTGMKTLKIMHKQTIPGVCKREQSTASIMLDGGVGH